MTFTKLFGFGLVLSLLLVAVKVFLYRTFNWEDVVIPHYFFWGMSFIASIVTIRMLGDISYLEAIMVSGVWLFMWLILDVIISARLLGYEIFLDPFFLINYLVVTLGMFLFHKKMHVAVRRRLAQKK